MQWENSRRELSFRGVITYFSPHRAVRIAVRYKGLRANFSAVSRLPRQQVVPIDNAYRISEMFMQVIHKLSDTVFQRRRHAQIVEDCQVLNAFAFAKTDAASMGADRDIEFGSHEEYGKVFIDTRQAAAINLAHVDSPCLHQLFEHHAIVAVFTR